MQNCPYFVFAVVSRRSPTRAKQLKVPVIVRQLVKIDRFLAAAGWSAGKGYFVETTYRRRAFVDHPVFHGAVAYARDNGVPLLVGDLEDLLSKVPAKEFAASIRRIADTDIELMDAATGKLAREFEARAWLAVHDRVLARARAGKIIAAGRRNGKKQARNGAIGQVRGAAVNRLRAQRLAESIRPVVRKMEAELADGRVLSQAALMRRLNELAIPGPKGGTWSPVSVGRALKILREADAVA